MSINRREVIKRTAVTMGGLAIVPMGLLKGCTPFVGHDNGTIDKGSGGNGSSGNGSSFDEGVRINSVSELRGTPGEVGETVTLTGYYEADDGGGSEVYWDEESTEDDDNGMIFKANGVSKGRWKRKDAGHINVKWFGAKGDGVYRSETLDIFNQCFDWIKTGNTKKIYVPAGLYIIRRAFVQLDARYHNGLELYGDGPEVSEIKFRDNMRGDGSDNNRRMLRWHSNQQVAIEDVHIHDIRFNGNRDANPDVKYSVLLMLYPNSSLSPSAKNILIENVHATGAEQSGIAIRTDNTIIRNCKSWNHGGHGCATGNHPDNVLVENYEAWKCGLHKNGRESGFYGLDFSNGTNLRANNFEIRACGAGFKTSGGIRGPVTLSNGYIHDSVDRNIRQTAEAHPDNTLTLTNITTENAGKDGNRFTYLKKITFNNFTSINDGGSGNSASIYLTSEAEDVEINGMTIVGSDNTGLLIQARGKVNIADLKLDGCSKGVDCNTDTVIDGISIKNADPCLDVSGNSSWEVSNIKFSGNSGATAIRVGSGSDVEVTDCDFTGISNITSGSGVLNVL